jgi:hypothetical protein
MMCPPFGPLRDVVAAGLEEFKKLEDGDWSLSDRRLNEEFLIRPFPETTGEINWLSNTSITVMAPDPGHDPVWRSLNRDYYGDWQLGSQRCRTQDLASEIERWVRDPHLGGGYGSFAKPDQLPFNRELALRRNWRLKDIIAPSLFDGMAPVA